MRSHFGSWNWTWFRCPFWDPRTACGHYLFLVLRPDRIQAWREANELAGRTLMRAGSWVV